MRFCILLPDSCTPAQCEGQGTARPAAGGVTPGQAVAAMHKIASTDHRPPPICRDARLGAGGGGGGGVEWSVGVGVGMGGLYRRLTLVVELIALSQIRRLCF